MVKYQLRTEKKDSDRTSPEFKERYERLCKYNPDPKDDIFKPDLSIYNFEVYDDIVKKVELSKDTTKELITTMYEKTISGPPFGLLRRPKGYPNDGGVGPYVISINSSIKYDMSSMKIFVLSDDEVDLSQVLKGAVYELHLGGCTIKKGYLSQGLEILEDTFVPFSSGPTWHNLTLSIFINNVDLGQVKLKINVLMNVYHISEEIKAEIMYSKITIPWKFQDLDGKMDQELLHFQNGMGHLLLTY